MSESTSEHQQLLRAFRQRVRDTMARQLEEEHAEAVRLRQEVLPKLQHALSEARASGLVGRVWLFGSFAWGEPIERSDVDLLVEDCTEPDGLAGRIWREVERPVHVIQLERAPESLITRALSEGQLL